MMGMLLTILLMAGAGYWYFSYSQREIGVLRENAAKLEQAVQTQQQAIQAMEQHAQAQAQNMLTLQTDLAGADSTRRSLEGRLRRANIQLMARTNAGDLERRINQATTEVFTDLERITTSQSVSGATAPPRRAEAPTDISTNTRSTNTATATANESANTAVNTANDQPPPRPPVRRSP